jgi:hypothetical protein
MRMTEPESKRARERHTVEVWCASFDTWVGGFDLVASTDDGCIVSRRSDGEVLPITFSDAHVRPPADSGVVPGARLAGLRPRRPGRIA